MISDDDLQHDTSNLFTFHIIMHRHVPENNIISKKYLYYWPGTTKFHSINQFSFNQDFGTEAEIHLQATAHGKGPCDSIDGNMKRLATRASLQSDSNKKITTSKLLYD